MFLSSRMHLIQVYLNNRFDKPDLKAVAPPPVASSTSKDQADAGALASALPPDVVWRLRGWVEELLRGGYNVLMQAARK